MYKFQEDEEVLEKYFEEFCKEQGIENLSSTKVLVKSVLLGKPSKLKGCEYSPCYELCGRYEYASNTSCEGARGSFCQLQENKNDQVKAFNFLPAIIQMKGTLEKALENKLVNKILGKRLDYFVYYVFYNSYLEYDSLNKDQKKTFNKHMDFSQVQMWLLQEPYISISDMSNDPWNNFMEKKESEVRKEKSSANLFQLLNSSSSSDGRAS